MAIHIDLCVSSLAVQPILMWVSLLYLCQDTALFPFVEVAQVVSPIQHTKLFEVCNFQNDGAPWQ